MGEPLLNNSILDQFVNSHEQSYEEFLSTFTYLLKEEEGKINQGSKVDSLRKPFPAFDLSSRSNHDSPPGRSKEVWVPLPPEIPSENERVMNESWKAGGSAGNDHSVPEGVKVNKDTDLEFTDMCEERCSGSFVLPGEAEQTMTYCAPFLEKPLQRKFRTLAVPQTSHSEAQKLLGDDVQPFSLDEEFDYDNVALTPKFSEAELKAIFQLSEEKKLGQMSSQHELKT
ncbi:LOW QUALITY PROTEIN: intraflagellar transport-associated protein [Indicator indicator]|uniref:LOW QUALITY PROTEIN: intraflagellar transport-associated protein n=1 Tax=Indicator indicator TaxID=1002788 RepID=UPI0023DFE2B9|nr:LOW QUALITY PROTEIN: intraflagellar transport-associated protein [Indicator indicator]